MHDLALEQIGHRRQRDVRMRPHVDAVPRREVGRPHVIEEDERPDHAPLDGGRMRRTEKPPRSRRRPSRICIIVS